MSKINDIQNGIKGLEGGRYQKLLECYLYKKYGYKNWTPFGSQLGTDKTTKGTPDAYVRTDEGKYIFIMYGTVQAQTFNKVSDDISSCLDSSKTGIDACDIEEIICCHTSARFNPGENKKLHDLFGNLKLIGIGELALDLLNNYQNLAKDYLNIAFDTDQIFQDEDFVIKFEENRFATSLKTELLCRNKEKDHLLKSLIDKDVIIINGKSGSGKTRLALEVAREYIKENDYLFKCIKQNGLNIFEDLKTYFIDDNNYIVLVDDANELEQLSLLLDKCVDSKRKHKIKLLLTVRDYVKENITKIVNEKLQPLIYKLETLSNENIRTILEQEFKIVNNKNLKQMIRISSGNLRLAIMATTAVLDGNLKYYNSVTEIYDVYFEKIIDQLDKKTIIIGAVVAFFDKLRLDNIEHLIYEIAENNEIKKEEINEILNILHNLEVVDMHNNLAVKISDQGLGNYFLYLVFYKEKYISLNKLINTSFPKYKERIIYIFNTLLNMFYSDELRTYAHGEIKVAWSTFQNSNFDLKSDFLYAFYIAIENEALLFIKQEIEKLPECNADFLSFNFESNSQNINSKLLRILANFKKSNQFRDAVELLIKHIERNTENPLDFYLLIKSHFTIDSMSSDNNYEKEILLLDMLWEYYKKTNNSNIAVLLIYLCKWLLKSEFETNEFSSNKTLETQRFGLTDCENLRIMRDKCISILFLLYDEKYNYQHKVLNAINSYNFLGNYELTIPIAESDLIKFNDLINKHFKMKDINECLIVEHLNKIKERYHLLDNTYFNQFEKNSLFSTYRKLKPDRLQRQSSKNYEEEFELQIETLAQNITLEELENIFMFTSRDLFSHSNDMSDGLSKLLSAIKEDVLFINAIKIYFNYNIQFYIQPTNITNRLVKYYGYYKCWDFIKKQNFNFKNNWINYLIRQANDDIIDTVFAKRVLDFMHSTKDDNYFIIPTLEVILRINKKCDGFAIKYLDLLYKKYSKTPAIIAIFLNTYSVVDLEINDIFNYPQNTIIEDAYLLALTSAQFYDEEQKLLLSLLKANSNFVKKLIKFFINNDFNLRFTNTLACLWILDNYKELIETAIKTIWQSESYLQREISSSIFTSKAEDLVMVNIQDEWLKIFIGENCNDDEKIKKIFEIICNFPEECRMDLILYFCKKNNNFNLFKVINFHPLSCISFVGSYAPYIEGDIDFLIKLKDNLQGIDFVEHRSLLDTKICKLKKYKESTLLREFTEEF